MGALTGGSYDASVRAILGTQSTDLLPTATLLRFTNAAYQTDICSRFDLAELDATDAESCVAGTATIAFSVTDVLIVKSISNTTDSQELIPISADYYTRLEGRSGSTTGTPTHYYRTGATTSGTVTFRLWPTPDAATALLLNYRKRPAALTDATATVIDTLFDEPITYYAASRAAMYLRMYGKEKNDAKELRSFADMLAADTARQLGIGSAARYPIHGPSLTGAMK